MNLFSHRMFHWFRNVLAILKKQDDLKHTEIKTVNLLDLPHREQKTYDFSHLTSLLLFPAFFLLWIQI